MAVSHNVKMAKLVQLGGILIDRPVVRSRSEKQSPQEEPKNQLPVAGCKHPDSSYEHQKPSSE
jgi:hypothetical protein